MPKVALKISSILLCGLLIYNSLGYFLVLTVMRVAVRQQKWVKLSLLPDENLKIFIFNKNNPKPEFEIENDHEIIVDGKLYDVVRKADDGKQIKYFCVWDHEEETLISKTRLFNSQAQQMPVQKTTRHIVEKIIKTGILNEETAFIIENLIIAFSNSGKVRYSGPEIQISLPPPQPLCYT